MTRNVVVKGEHSEGADRTFVQLVSSSGDKSPALFRETAFETFPFLQPSMTAVGSSNVSGNTRRVRTRVVFPLRETDAAGNPRQTGQIVFNVDCSLPLTAAAADANDASAVFGNLMASAEIRQIHQTGYVPNDFTYTIPT